MKRRVWAFTIIAALLLGTGAAPRAQAPSRLTFDGKGHLLMNGVPTFGLGVYDSGIGPLTDAASWDASLFDTLSASSSSTELKSTRGLGPMKLNMYLNYQQGQDTTEQTTALLSALASHGLMYFQTANCFSGTSYTATAFSVDDPATGAAYAQALAQSPAMAGYYVMDECDDSLLAETQTHHAAFVGKDAAAITLAVPVAFGDHEPNVWVNPARTSNGGIPSAGLFGTDPYPLYGAEPPEGYPHFRVPDQIARLRARRDQPLPAKATCGPTGVTTPASHDPVLAVLQLFAFGGGRLPTAGEMKMHAYASIVEGAQGIFWWSLGDGGLRDSGIETSQIATWTGYLTSLVDEIAGLNGALVAAPPAADPLVSNSSSATGAATGNPPACADAIAWRKAVVATDIKNSGLSYAEQQWYQAELNALNAGDTSRSPMLQQTAGVAPLQAGDVRTRTFYGPVTNTDGTTTTAYVLVAYNYTNKTENVTFGWNRGTPSPVTVWNEGRTLGASAAGAFSFADSFGPFQAHVYVIQ